MAFYPGSTVRLSCRFRDLVGHVDYEPEGVLVRVQLAPTDDDPTPTEESWEYGTDPEVVRDAYGKYHLDYVPATAGIWEFRFEGTGTEPVAAEGKFRVQASDFPVEAP